MFAAYENITKGYGYRANETITLSESEHICIDGESLEKPAKVMFRLLPRPSIVVEADDLPGVVLSKRDVFVTLQNGTRIEMLVGSTTLAAHRIGDALVTDGVSGTLVPVREPFIALSQQNPLRSVRFSVLNFPGFYGSDDQWIEVGHTHHRLGAARLETTGWSIEIVEVFNCRDNIKVLKSDGGYAITHTGSITRSDGDTFSVEEAERLLSGLQLFLSFVRGIACGLTMVEGTDQRGTIMGKVGYQSRRIVGARGFMVSE